MRILETKLFSFSELNSEAKQTAIEQYRESVLYKDGYYCGNEVIQSINFGLDHFNFNLKKYCIDWDNINCSDTRIEYLGDDNVIELSYVRLWKYLQNSGLLTYFCRYDKKKKQLLSGNCPFTGVCFDEDFLDPVREFIKNPKDITFEELIQDCVHSCLLAGCNDWEYILSDESITEYLHDNDFEFTESGEFFLI
jgi:hypothetical protein